MESNSCVHELLEAQAICSPRSVAVLAAGRSLTYQQLDEQSNRLARVLRKAGVSCEVRVGLYVERSIEMVVALLGILKAGGAYVPIDPAHGKGRMEHIAGEMGFNLLLTQESLTSLLPTLTAKILLLEETQEAARAESAAAMESEAKPSDLAYMIYTSGSTGKPKGVQIEHRSVVNFLHSMHEAPGVASSDTLLAVTTLAFDIAALEIFLPLFAGGRVVIASRETASDGRLLAQALEKFDVTVMQATPATWRMLIESGWRGNRRLKVLVGGESLPADLGRELVSRSAEVWNMYGPTETTIWSSIRRVTGKEEHTVPIGSPIRSTEFHILSSDGRAVGPGEEGELCIGGEGLARGYYERPQLTAEKFIPDSFSSRLDARLYRTGDLVRCGPDGEIHFLGRIDHQVKVRGFRIEPGEIEEALVQYPQIRQSVVVAREDRLGEKFLTAYIVPDSNGTVTPAQLRRYLAGKLPEYMVPRAFVRLAALPLTPNRKVDRAALPPPQSADFDQDVTYVPPRDATERKLVELWEEILNVRPIGIRTSFFDLGGHSLLAVRLFMKILPVFARDLPISTLFRAPTIEKLAEELRASASGMVYRTLVPIKPSGSKPPFFCVHGGLGSTLFFGPLASHLDRDQPFYGIESDGLDGGPFRYRTIEETARYYISELQKVQPVGPYLLGGYCLGGIIAFEMARQLVRQGERVALLAQFSCPLFYNHFEKPVPIPTRDHLGKLLRSPWKTAKTELWTLQNATRIQTAMIAYRVILQSGLCVPQWMRTLYIPRMWQRIEQKYVPRPYQGTLAMFYTPNPDHTAPNLGWNGLAESFEKHVIGDQETTSLREVMREPLVRQLAAELTGCLERACAELEPALADQ